MLNRFVLALALIAAPAMAATPPVATVAAASNVLIDHSGSIASINIVTGASPGYLIVVDSATIPADGSVKPIQCVPIAATTGIMVNYRSDPIAIGYGAAVMFSTGASCFALVKSATAFISVEVR